MTRERMTQFLIKFAYAAVILGLIFAGFKYVLPLLMPFLLAFVFSVLLRTPAAFLSRKLKISQRLVSAILVTLLFILLAVLALLLGSELLTFARTSVSWFNTVIVPAVESLTEAASKWTKRLDPNVVSALDGIVESVLLSLRTKIAEISTRLVTAIMSSVPSSFLNVIFMIIATYFISLDFGLLRWAVARRIREEVYKNINWWLEKGLGGFRVDAIINIKKPETFQNYPVDRADGLSNVRHMLEDARGIGKFLGEMQKETFSRYDAFSVGEVFNERKEEIPNFIGENGYFSSMFDFAETIFGASEKGWYDNKPCLPDDYKRCVFDAQKRVGTMGFLSNIIENHDEPRGVSRYIPAEDLCKETKKLLATVYFLLRGIPFIFQGQELGMENRMFPSAEEFDDVSSIDEYQVALKAGLSEEEALRAVSAYSRDNARTPVQWSAGKNAGFTEGTPWLNLNENYVRINAEDNLADPDSIYHYYQKLIKLRKDPAYKDTLVYGTLT